MKPGLDALLSPHSKQLFLTRHWPENPFVVHGLGKTVRALTEIPFLQSLDALLNSWPNSVQAHLPDLADEASSVDASPGDARKLFANHMGLLFNNAQKISPVLNQWLSALHADLGLPALTHGRCMMYATPDGRGTAPHFDQNINFILQLHGTKKWRLAPNENCENPMQRHTMGLSLDPELKPYCQGLMPQRMPTASREITLKPGSLLFVPRGYWHSTEAECEALSLNFTYSQPTWIDLFTAALRSRLSLSSEWRELADGVSSTDATRRKLAQNKFDALLLELTEDLPNWKASGILAATEVADTAPDHSIFRRITSTQVVVKKNKVVFTPRDQSSTELEISSDLVPLFRWLIRKTAKFTIQDLQQSLKQSVLSSDGWSYLVESLIEEKVIRRV